MSNRGTGAMADVDPAEDDMAPNDEKRRLADILLHAMERPDKGWKDMRLASEASLRVYENVDAKTLPDAGRRRYIRKRYRDMMTSKSAGERARTARVVAGARKVEVAPSDAVRSGASGAFADPALCSVVVGLLRLREDALWIETDLPDRQGKGPGRTGWLLERTSDDGSFVASTFDEEEGFLTVRPCTVFVDHAGRRPLDPHRRLAGGTGMLPGTFAFAGLGIVGEHEGKPRYSAPAGTERIFSMGFQPLYAATVGGDLDMIQGEIRSPDSAVLRSIVSGAGWMRTLAGVLSASDDAGEPDPILSAVLREGAESSGGAWSTVRPKDPEEHAFDPTMSVSIDHGDGDDVSVRRPRTRIVRMSPLGRLLRAVGLRVRD